MRLLREFFIIPTSRFLNLQNIAEKDGWIISTTRRKEENGVLLKIWVSLNLFWKMGRDGVKLFLFLMRPVLSIWLKIGLIHLLTSKGKVKNKDKNIFAKKSSKSSKSKLSMLKTEKNRSNLRIKSLKMLHNLLRKRKYLTKSDKWTQKFKRILKVMSKYPPKDIQIKMSKTVLLKLLRFHLLTYHLSVKTLT